MIPLDDESLYNFRSEFAKYKQTDKYKAVYEKENPLVSVLMTTYNGADMLLNRSLKSVLDQTYKNLEIIVVADCSTDDTEERVLALKDPRITFRNIPFRGYYPTGPGFKLVAGTYPINIALTLATGDFVTHLDHDDVFFPQRVERLVKVIQETKMDLIFHPWEIIDKDGSHRSWNIDSRFMAGHITTSSVFYHSFLKYIPWDINAYKINEPGDWDRFRKFPWMGCNIGYLDEILLYPYD